MLGNSAVGDGLMVLIFNPISPFQRASIPASRPIIERVELFRRPEGSIRKIDSPRVAAINFSRRNLVTHRVPSHGGTPTGYRWRSSERSRAQGPRDADASDRRSRHTWLVTGSGRTGSPRSGISAGSIDARMASVIPTP